MTESARVKRYVKAEYQLTDGDGELVEYSDYAKLEQDRDAQAALVEMMRKALENASPRCESKIGNCEGECPTCVEYNEALDTSASSALQEFKERCWRDGIEVVIDEWLGTPRVKADRDLADKLVAKLKGSGK